MIVKSTLKDIIAATETTLIDTNNKLEEVDANNDAMVWTLQQLAKTIEQALGGMKMDALFNGPDHEVTIEID